VQKFPELLALLVVAMEFETADHLGTLFHDLALHKTWKGQFFTPYNLCQMMASMAFGDDAKETIDRRGFITAAEPACGSGAMVIALADAMKSEGLNYQRQLHVTATDVDIRCVHMAYVQLSLMHIPAIIVHGNTITMEQFGIWHTPAHILGGWDFRLRHMHQLEATAQVDAVSHQPSGDTDRNTVEAPVTPSAQLSLF
jgi:hypothetical protein